MLFVFSMWFSMHIWISSNGLQKIHERPYNFLKGFLSKSLYFGNNVYSINLKS